MTDQAKASIRKIERSAARAASLHKMRMRSLVSNTEMVVGGTMMAFAAVWGVRTGSLLLIGFSAFLACGLVCAITGRRAVMKALRHE